MSDVKAFVDEKINKYKVAVFSKSYCPYCHKAKNALESFAYKPDAFYWLEIDNRPDCNEIQDYLHSITGGRFVFFYKTIYRELCILKFFPHKTLKFPHSIYPSNTI